MPLLTERDRLGIWGYKHVARPEQEPLDTDDDHFLQSPCEQSWSLNRSHGSGQTSRFSIYANNLWHVAWRAIVLFVFDHDCERRDSWLLEHLAQR
jgi:hypothetical protein